MSEYIEVGQPLQFTDPNTPTRVGEIVENVSDIYNIPSPRLGMQVFVKSEKKSFVITSLKSKVIGGVDVPEAAVEAFEPVGAKSITWNNDTNQSNMNDFVVAGVYDIKGERTRIDDNLPVLNTGGGHSFNARLTVLDSSISGSGKDDDKCITQVMSFNNRLGQGEVYIRTGKGAYLDNLTWEKWSTLQRNVNVGEVTSLDHLIDNGIYSGIWREGSFAYVSYPFTFVCVVINDYFLGGSSPRKVSQFVYGVSALDGTTQFKYRVKIGNDKWGDWEILNKNEINSMITDAVDVATKAFNSRIDNLIDGAPETLDTLKEIADWVNTHEDLYQFLESIVELNTQAIEDEKTRAENAEKDIKRKAVDVETLNASVLQDKVNVYFRSLNGVQNGFTFPAATTETAGVMSATDKVTLDKATTDIKANAGAIVAEKERAEKHLAAEIDKIKDGDTIVGQAREINSRNGKTVTDSFLSRTTAGSGTIGDGVASLKSVGGNVVKNLAKTFSTLVGSSSEITAGENGVFKYYKMKSMQTFTTSPIEGFVDTHKYYIWYYNFTNISNTPAISLGYGYSQIRIKYFSRTSINKWELKSIIHTFTKGDVAISNSAWWPLGTDYGQAGDFCYYTEPTIIDLTEMFGVGKEPTKEECDKLFGTMDALPQGLTVAKPNTFTSTGFNQFNPDNVLKGKAIVDNAIVPGDKKIAVIPCLPCKVGVGENNGYCIHGEFGEDIKVYLTPLNPMEVDGELYMHELTKDATTDTYVPLIKGYMLVEVPTTANLCAHFLWSEDKCKRDTYEPYFESKIELPDIPQMSERGLAGIQSNGTLVCDEIDFRRGVYRKKIYAQDLYTSSGWIDKRENFNYFLFPATVDASGNNIMCERYTRIQGNVDALLDKSIILFQKKYICIRDDAYTTIEDFKASLDGVYAYYAMAIPEEYPLPKVDNNYISSDYGVEQFDAKVPCNANNLYYMRSLAGETRNFLDKMYDNTAKTDAKEVADYITNNLADKIPLATTENDGLMSMEDKLMVVNNTLSLKYGRNLFIKDDAAVVGHIQPNGNLNPNYKDWFTTENFVNVKPNTDYKRTSVVTVAFYDINKNFVKQVDFSKGETFTSPSNAYFAKFSVQNKFTSMVSEADKWEDTYIVGKYPEIGTTAETKFSLPELSGEEVAAYKIATLGDSITRRGQWQKIIEHNCGFGFFNNGLSGRAIQYFAFHRVDGTESDYDRILVASDFVGVDAIVICGYANSLWSKIGSMNEEFITINAEDANADLSGYPGRIGQYGYVSALRSVIEYIMSICPAIPIVISSQLPMSRPLETWNGATTDVDFDRVYNVSNKTCKDFSEATKEVAEHYHLPFVDLHNNGQVNIHNYSTYYDGDDTTHPNFRSYNSQIRKFPVSGMRLMASLIGDAIKKVI